MDYTTLMLYLFGAVSTLYVLHFGFYLIGANAYDVWQSIRRQRRYETAASGFIKLYKPLVTVVISARNEEKVIARCLDSIYHGTYRKVQVIVIDDASHDSTYRVLKGYQRSYPNFDLRVIRRRSHHGKGSALNYALRQYTRGELVMTCDADSVLASDAIANAASYFVDPTVAGVAANVQTFDDFTILGVLQKFEYMVGYRSKKVYSLLNCEFVVGGVASTYRMKVLREVGFYDTDTMTEDIGLSLKVAAQGNRTHRLLYASDVVAVTEGVASFRGLLRQRFRWKYGSFQNLVKYRHLIHKDDPAHYTRALTHYRLPMAVTSEFMLLLAPLVWLYVLYWTFVSVSLWLIIGAYLTITVYTLVILWFDENLSLLHRAQLSFYVPIAYFIYYIMDIVQVIAMIMCMQRIHHILKRKSLGSAWVSPQRIGQELIVG